MAREVNHQILQEMPFFVGADVNLTLDMALNMESVFYAAFEVSWQPGDTRGTSVGLNRAGLGLELDETG